MPDLLSQIYFPADVRTLAKSQLPQLCEEIRQFIIDSVSTHGGHFGAGLGVVELTVALHYVFNTPNDRLIWDVGHQAYAHKIITGRRLKFHTNRKWGGLSGFPQRSESDYDAFGTGHASTSISAALGMAIASRQKAEKRWHLAVIGDGALTGGLAFEALNQAATEKLPLLIVINDNAMSIDPNVGGLQEHLNQLKAGLREGPNLFENLGLRYEGPLDGHDVNLLVDHLSMLKQQEGPIVLHLKTTKGKGYTPAEQAQTQWHATGAFDKIKGYADVSPTQTGPRFQDVFGHTLLELAQNNDKLVGITPAMPSGSSMSILQQALPQRAFDVGIAEAHAVSLAAGMASEGLKPFCAIYSTFLQRAYDQLIHDVALQNLPVVFCIDRAGLVGADGPTHHGAFDLAYLRCIPNMVVAAAANERELRHLMFTAATYTDGPFAIRYPRGNGFDQAWKQEMQYIPPGTSNWLKTGEEVLVISIGTMARAVSEALKDTPFAHVDLRYVKPLDENMLQEALLFPKIITVEDGCINGGAGSAIGEWLLAHGYSGKFKTLGLPDAFLPHGSQSELYAHCGLDMANIRKKVLHF
jgi:1-deoxy-D-xylulose-5-phosphate synthase